MDIQEMTAPDCRALLSRATMARLACARDNQPYIVPIHVDLDGDFLYGHATLGQKIEWMRQNAQVCLEIDELDSDRTWATVVVFGHYEELPHTAAHESARNVAERLFQRHPSWWEPGSVPLAGQPQRPPIVFRIRIDRMSGRVAAPDSAKIRDAARQPRWMAQILRGVVSRP